MTKVLNTVLSSRADSSQTLSDLYSLMNTLIHPQKIKLTLKVGGQPDREREQQERVRDCIQYLKAAKSVLASTQASGEDSLFALSDVIQEVNASPIIRHVMCLYEAVVGREVEKLSQESLTYEEIGELQSNLGPLMTLLSEERPPQPARSPQPPKKHFINKGIQVAPKVEQAIATLR